METIKNILIKLSLVVIIVSVLSITFIDHTTRTFFGYKITSVSDNTMSDLGFNQNDLILIKEINPFVLGKDDIITFRSTNSSNYFEIVTRKIRERIIGEDNYPVFKTYNLENGEDDEKIVEYEYIVGEYKTTIKGAGILFKFLKSTIGYITCIFIPFCILLFTFIVDRIKFKTPKRNKLQIETRRRVSKNAKKEIVVPKVRKTNH